MLNSWVKMDQDKATWGTLELALSNANRVELGLDPLLERKENMCNAIERTNLLVDYSYQHLLFI